MSEEKKLTGNETPEELVERMKEHAKKELERVGFTENIKNALDFAKTNILLKQKALNFRELMKLAEEEGLEVPESYGKHAKSLEMEAQNMLSKIPDQLELAMEDMTHERLLGFIEGFPVTDEDATRNNPEYLLLIKYLTDDHKEKIFHTIREQKITDMVQADRVNDFEWYRLKYSYKFAQKHLMDEIPEDTEMFFDFLEKHTKGYTKHIDQTLEWADMVRDGHYDNKLIHDRAYIILGRFGIKGETPEETKALAEEVFHIMQKYFDDTPYHRGEEVRFEEEEPAEAAK